MASAIDVVVNGRSVAFPDQRPIIRDRRVQVPLRVVFQALGADVQWFPKNRKVVAMRAGKTVSLVLGENVAYANNRAVPLDYPPRVVRGRIMVPLRFVAETLGAKVVWRSQAKRAIIDLPPANRIAPG